MLRTALLASLLVGCGGRSERELPAVWGVDGAAGATDSGNAPGNLDTRVLADQRCAGFALPAAEVQPFARYNGYPRFGACGHFAPESSDPVDIVSPDAASVVAASVRDVRFSSEGTRAIFVPVPPGNLVRRLDLSSGASFDTVLDLPADGISSTLGYGLFLSRSGDVESWVCNGTRLRIFADRGVDEPALLDVDVPTCSPQWANDGVLLWQSSAQVTALDLRAPRLVEHVLSPYLEREPAVLASVLDGYAAAPVVIGTERSSAGPLYSMRTGDVLADTWESVAMADGRYAANRIASGFSLLIDDGRATVAVPGLRGLYVFRDQTRAFALRPAATGAAELVFADLTSGATQVIAEYSSLALDEAQPYTPSFGVSPHERAAYFVLGPDDGEPPSPDPLRGVVRWLDGAIEALDETVPPSAGAPAVADDGTAVFDATTSSLRFRPGAATLVVQTALGLLLSNDGSADVRSTPDVPAGTTSKLLVADLDSGAQRALATGIVRLDGIVFDPAHARLAFGIGNGADASSEQLWLGRFPGAHQNYRPVKSRASSTARVTCRTRAKDGACFGGLRGAGASRFRQ